MNTNEILASLGRVSKLFYTSMLEKLNSGNYPKDNSARGHTSIQHATSQGSPFKDNKSFKVNITIDLKKAPFAAAYEWGSGEHGEGGGTYPIVPKRSPDMIFPIEDWPDFVPGLTSVAPNKNGLFFLIRVEHPGVEAKPYIEPTIKNTQEEVKKILGEGFKAAILYGEKKVEVIK